MSESIDAIRPGISDILRADIAHIMIKNPESENIECTVCFSGGSLMEIICKKIETEILDFGREN